MIRSVTMALGACMFAFALNQGMTQEIEAPKPAVKASERAKQMPFRGTIVKIDLEAKTVTLGGKEKDRTFVMTDQTRIKKDGESAKLEDVRAGQSVGGLARANGDKWEVVTLNVSEKPDKAPAREALTKQDE